ncbi:MAG: hypothetical protein ABIH39_09030, partial [Candidatus Margulisiibacteriota bacterium]
PDLMSNVQGIQPNLYPDTGPLAKSRSKTTPEQLLAAAMKKDPEAFAKLSGKLELANIDSKKVFKAIQDMINA